MEVIKDVSQLKPAPASGGAGQPPTPPNRPFAPGDQSDYGDDIRRIGRNDHFGAGYYHAGNSRAVGQVGEYYDHRPRRSGVTGLARDMSKAFNYSQGVGKVDEGSKQDQDKKWSEAKKATQKPLKEGPPKPPAKKKV